jgi:hypothetical protein
MPKEPKIAHVEDRFDTDPDKTFPVGMLPNGELSDIDPETGDAVEPTEENE